MKIYESVTIDISSGEIIEERSYDYSGPLALTKGGGGGGGSGEVDYPEYMKALQADWLGGGDYLDVGTLTSLTAGNDMTSLLDIAVDNSPFAYAEAYDPADEISGMDTAVKNYCAGLIAMSDLNAYQRLQEFMATLDGFDNSNYMDATEDELNKLQPYINDMVYAAEDLETYITSLDSTADLKALINSLNSPSGALDSYLDGLSENTANIRSYLDTVSTTSGVENELGQFNAGMANINAVNSSSFAIGHQIVASNLIETKLNAEGQISQLDQRFDEMVTGGKQAVAQIENQFNQIKVTGEQTIGQLKTEGQQAVVQMRASIAQASQNLTNLYISKAKVDLQKGLHTLTGSREIASLAINHEKTNAQFLQDKRLKTLHYSMEQLRMSIASSVEERNKNIKLDKNDSLWPLEVFQKGGNVLAGIGGGTVSRSADDEISDGQAAMGGAMSGAAAGAMIGAEYGTAGGWWGAAIGAVVGGVGGALMN